MGHFSDSAINGMNAAISYIDFFCFAVMFWECVVTLWFDYEIVSRKRPFKWPVLIYWLAKYGTFGFLIVINAWYWTPHMNCQGTTDMVNLMSGIGMAAASGLLMLRALALWQNDRKVVIPVGLMHLGLWIIVLHNGFYAKTSSEVGCETLNVQWSWIQCQYIYTMVHDLVILVLACYHLFGMPSRSPLWTILFVDGVVYYLLATTLYLLNTIVVYLSPGQQITPSYLFSDITVTLITIVTCRAFVRLYTLRPADESTIIDRNAPSTMKFAPGPRKGGGFSSLFTRGGTTTDGTTDVEATAGVKFGVLPKELEETTTQYGSSREKLPEA